MAKIIESAGGPAIELADRLTIGADPASDLRIDDPLVAAHHAEIRRGSDGRYRVVDLGSRHGTFHGARRVSESLLAPGDELLIGSARLRFEEAVEETPPAAGGAAAEHFPPASAIGDLETLRRNHDLLRTSYLVSQGLAGADEPRQALEVALDTALRELAADCGLAVLLNPATLQPRLQLTRSRAGGRQFQLSTSLLSEVIRGRQGMITADPGAGQQPWRASSLDAQSLRSVASAPVLSHGQLLAVLQIGSQRSGSFDAGHLEVLELIAQRTAPALERALLSERVHAVSSDERMRLSRLVGDLPDGLVLLDAGGHVALLNRRGEELLGLLGAAGVGDRVEQLGSVRLGELLERRSCDVTVRGPPRRVLELRASESANDDGNEVVLVLRDVTEEREHESRMAQQDRLATIGRLTGGVAHDFNNLLAVISNFAAFIREGVAEQSAREDAAEIERAADRAAALVKQLVAFGRPEAVRPKVVTLEQVLDGMLPMLARLLGPQLKLELRRSPEACRVKVDPARLEQVILNLAVNARDAMSGAGTLTLETGALDRPDGSAGLPAGTYAFLSVRDTGTGMSPEVSARIFEPFFTTKERGKGTGLGLATAFGIVQQAGGAILVDSEVGKGSELRVLLPITEDAESTSDLALRSLAGGHETVLVAEDEEPLRRLLRRILASAGYRVLDAPDGEAALALARKSGPIDLLLTDLVMPGMSGKELAKRVTEESPATRVLYISGFFAEGAGHADEVQLVAKPFSRAQLLAQVRIALTA